MSLMVLIPIKVRYGTLRLQWVIASEPLPDDEAVDVDRNVTLNWQPGYGAISHEVYFGTDFNQVNDGVNPVVVTPVNNYTPCLLDAGTTYFWRVDEFDGSAIHKGDVWAFNCRLRHCF